MAGTLVQSRIGKNNATIFAYNRNFKDDDLYKVTLLDKTNPVYKDRFAEVKRFFNKSTLGMLLHFAINGTPNTNYYKYRLERIFEGSWLDPNNLRHTYERSTFMYTNRLMLRYHNYKKGAQILELANALSLKKESLRVLDYGCGVADPSLFLALHGVDVTIVDLDDTKLEFARARFNNRGLSVRCVAAKQTEKPVDPGSEKYDVIIMAEFLEHVRNPRLFLEFALDHLNDKHGVFYDSLGPEHNHGIGGDHLAEAKTLMDGSDYAEYFSKKLCPINEFFGTDRYPHFYVKR